MGAWLLRQRHTEATQPHPAASPRPPALRPDRLATSHPAALMGLFAHLLVMFRLQAAVAVCLGPGLARAFVDHCF